ncbi:MAG: hypothetical protein ACI85O_000106 [Saprospiraceae bacterium]
MMSIFKVENSLSRILSGRTKYPVKSLGLFISRSLK